jgi:hypothetical protein
MEHFDNFPYNLFSLRHDNTTRRGCIFPIYLKEMYKEDADFKEDYEACNNPLLGDKIPSTEYLIQERLLFKGS